MTEVLHSIFKLLIYIYIFSFCFLLILYVKFKISEQKNKIENYEKEIMN